MLFNLKNKNNKKSFRLNPAVLSGALPSFDPINLPSFKAGYYMNSVADIPQGSFPVIPPNTQFWYDINNLVPGALSIQSGIFIVHDIVNGFKCLNRPGGASSSLFSFVKDQMTGVTDFTILWSFKKPAVAVQYCFYMQNAAGTVRATMFISATGLITTYYDNFVPGNKAISVNRYDDNIWHVAIVQFNQTAKTITLTTELETANAANPAFGLPIAFTSAITADFNLSGVKPAATAPFIGSIGDIIILNGIPTALELTNLLIWEKTRLGI